MSVKSAMVRRSASAAGARDLAKREPRGGALGDGPGVAGSVDRSARGTAICGYEGHPGRVGVRRIVAERSEQLRNSHPSATRASVLDYLEVRLAAHTSRQTPGGEALRRIRHSISRLAPPVAASCISWASNPRASLAAARCGRSPTETRDRGARRSRRYLWATQRGYPWSERENRPAGGK
jgi:hypothetical protein